MINKIKTVELIEKSMLQQISKDIFLVNAIPPNTFTNEKGILIEILNGLLKNYYLYQE
jgi:hypothetical protein